MCVGGGIIKEPIDARGARLRVWAVGLERPHAKEGVPVRPIRAPSQQALGSWAIGYASEGPRVCVRVRNEGDKKAALRFPARGVRAAPLFFFLTGWREKSFKFILCVGGSSPLFPL